MSFTTIRMIASDIDGTLLHRDGSISAYTVDVIHETQRRGILFTVCSGRYPEHADVILKTYGIRCPVTGNNGATQWDAETDTILSDHFMTPQSARMAREAADDLGIPYIVFGRKHVSASRASSLHSSQKRYGRILQEDYHIQFDYGRRAVDETLAKPVNKFYFHYDLPEEKEQLVAALRQVPDISITTSGIANVEIIPAGCNKAAGVLEMARLFHVDMSSVMTIGDYENDVPMLQAAGLGVAMGNALDNIKHCVNHVTASNDEDGLAKAIEKYVLK